jgi:hypothetical protein
MQAHVGACGRRPSGNRLSAHSAFNPPVTRIGSLAGGPSPFTN